MVSVQEALQIVLNNSLDTPKMAQKKKITKSSLLNLYIEILNEKLVFEKAIRKFNLVDTSQYNDDQDYSEKVTELASSIKILNPYQNFPL